LAEPDDYARSSPRYVYFNFNTRNGPVVVEIPPAVEAGLFGTFLDAWQVPLAEVGPQGEDALTKSTLIFFKTPV
jgi:hypothetical protein